MLVAVTGGRGRLGRYVVAELRTRHDVRVLDRAPPASPAAGYPVVDILDEARLAEAIRGREVVVHLAGIDRSLASAPGRVIDTNVRGTWNVFEAAEKAGVRRIVLCSSIAALGLDHSNPNLPPLFLPVNEEHPARPSEAYGISKYIGEQIAAAFARRAGLEVLILRPSYIAFPEMIAFLSGTRNQQTEREAEPVPYLRSYVGPEDTARAFALAVGHVYDGVAAFHISASDTFIDDPTLDHVRRTYGMLPPIRRPELYRENPRAGVFDIDRAQRALGWQPMTTWRELRVAHDP